MKNMLLAVIFGPIEIVVPVLLGFLGVGLILWLLSFVMVKKEERDVLNKAMVVYPETLLEDIQTMKKYSGLRLYSKRVENNLFAITSNAMTEEYKDGIFVSYAGEKPEILKTKKMSLKDFINLLPEINYKSMIKRIGFKTRIECHQKEVKNTKIKRIRLCFEYYSENIFFYNSDDEIIKWEDSFLPDDWQTDRKFYGLSKNLCRQYEALFVKEGKEVSYVGIKNEQQKIEIKKAIEDFVNYVYEKNAGKYEIINNLDVNKL